MKSLLRSFANVIAPARCLNCLAENTWLCPSCAASLPIDQPTHPTKLQSSWEPLTGLTAAGPYRHPVFQRLVGWLKFKGVRALAPLAAALIADQLAAIAPLSILRRQAALVPIPLHPARARTRGFNQSEEITQALAEQTGIAILTALIRSHHTWTQSQLPHHLRSQNMDNAFAVQNSLPDKKYFLLIDDVSTTGSTLVAAGAALRPHTKAQLWGCVVAQG